MIKNYSIAFVTLVKEWKDDMPDLKGSGTLIQVGEYKCVLTAADVIELLQKYEKIAFVIENDVETNIAYSTRYFPMEIIDLENPENLGPDIGIINIPTKFMEYISSKKPFINLHTYRKNEWYKDEKEGDWCLFGGIGEGTKVDYEEMKVRFELTTLFTGTAPNCFIKDGYDYLEKFFVGMSPSIKYN